MAKNKNVVIRNEGLVPTTIGVIDNNKVGLIYLTITFISLLIFVFYLPEVFEFIESKKQVDAVSIDPTKYTFSQGMDIVDKEVTYTNISFIEDELSFNIVSNNGIVINMLQDSYIFKVYNDSGLLVTSLDFSGVTVEGSQTFSQYIGEESISYFTVE